jgi:glycosyltransferase involved in cell wall biosynthesis
MPLRILHVFRPVDSDVGRSIEAVCELSRAQRQFGHVVEIATLGPPRDARLEELPVQIHALGKGLGTYGYDAHFVRWMRDNAGGFDCVIVHGIWDFCALGTWWALRDTNVPFFIFTHGTLDPWFKTHQPMRHLLRWLYWPWGAFPVLRDAHAVFFLTDDERHRARQAFWLYDCHEFVVRVGTQGIPPAMVEDSADVFLATHRVLHGKKLFTVFSDDNRVEGLDVLTEAIDMLFRKGVWNARFMRLVVAGPVDRAVKDAVGRFAGSKGLGDCICWMENPNEFEKWGLLRASDVFLRLSSYEICGNRVAESLSAGTPVLVSTGVAVWKDIVNDGAGFADDATIEGCARMLERWIGLSVDEQSAIRFKARACFEDRYTLAGAAHTLTSAIYLFVGVHRDGRWDLRPLKPASELL